MINFTSHIWGFLLISVESHFYGISIGKKICLPTNFGCFFKHSIKEITFFVFFGTSIVGLLYIPPPILVTVLNKDVWWTFWMGNSPCSLLNSPECLLSQNSHISLAKTIRFLAKSQWVGSFIKNNCWTNHQSLVFFGSSIMFNPNYVKFLKTHHFCFLKKPTPVVPHKIHSAAAPSGESSGAASWEILWRLVVDASCKGQEASGARHQARRTVQAAGAGFWCWEAGWELHW